MIWIGDKWKVMISSDTEPRNWAGIKVKVGETWAVGYRPQKCRVTFQGAEGGCKLCVLDTGLDSMGSNLAAVSPAEIDLDFSSGLDIGYLMIRDGVGGDRSMIDFWVTNIEFCE